MAQTIKDQGQIVNVIRDAKEEQGLRWRDIERGSGVNHHGVALWSNRKGMNVHSLLRVLDALGLEIVIRRKGESEHDS